MNASMLPQFSGKLVCLVGNVTEVRRYEKLEVFTRVSCQHNFAANSSVFVLLETGIGVNY